MTYSLSGLVMAAGAIELGTGDIIICICMSLYALYICVAPVAVKSSNM